MTNSSEFRQDDQKHDIFTGSDDSDDNDLNNLFDESQIDQSIYRVAEPAKTIIFETTDGNVSINIGLTGEHSLWGHKLWNSAKYLANCFHESFPGFPIKNLSVLELGAGSALPSVMAAKCGAKRVVATDYPNDEILKNIQTNFQTNLTPEQLGKTVVLPHLWGKDVNHLIAANNNSKFDVIIMCDLIFNHAKHIDLISIVKKVMKPTGSTYMLYGHHTYLKMCDDLRFFYLLSQMSLEYTKVTQVQMEPMFPDDFGPKEVRAQVYGWKITFPRT